MRIFILLIIISILSVNVYAGGITSDPETWQITYSTVFKKDGKPVNKYIEKLLKNLQAEEGEGLLVSLEEFLNHLKRKEASEVYTKDLVRYATPKSRHIQKTQHNNYTKVFLQEKRIKRGVEFLNEYKTLLSDAENIYNVSRKDIVSILMWESGLGEFTGKLRVFNIFMGQILFLDEAQEYAIEQMKKNGEKYPNENTDTPQKQKERFEAIRNSAVKGLTALFRYSKVYNYDPILLKGSWGGAIGYTQFMPYRFNLAVDGDNDGDVDLFSWPDAIFSVANYLHVYGKYDWDYKKRKRAIRSYNNSDEYMNGVIAYADTIWQRYKGF